MSDYTPTTEEPIDGEMGPNVSQGVREYADWVAGRRYEQKRMVWLLRHLASHALKPSLFRDGYEAAARDIEEDNFPGDFEREVSK